MMMVSFITRPLHPDKRQFILQIIRTEIAHGVAMFGEFIKKCYLSHAAELGSLSSGDFPVHPQFGRYGEFCGSYKCVILVTSRTSSSNGTVNVSGMVDPLWNAVPRRYHPIIQADSFFAKGNAASLRKSLVLESAAPVAIRAGRRDNGLFLGS